MLLNLTNISLIFFGKKGRNKALLPASDWALTFK
jgi:hypothetical protein